MGLDAENERIICDGCDEEIQPDQRFYDIEDRFRMGEDKVSEPTVRTILCWDCGEPIRKARKPDSGLKSPTEDDEE